MKLTGTLRRGRHLFKNANKAAKDSSEKAEGAKKSRWRKPLIIVSIVIGSLGVLTAATFAYFKLAVKPPPVNDSLKGNQTQVYNAKAYDPLEIKDSEEPPDIEIDNTEDVVPDAIRNENKYTFILFVTDGSANTDVIMVITFDESDADNYILNVVSIPRDTMANVSWGSKKANAIRANRRAQFRGQGTAAEVEEKAMAATIESFSDILGFEVDYWFNVDLKAFITLVDAVGGVDFYIPSNMEYHDPEQNLHISYKQGMHKGLTGQQAMEVLRFRKYASGDIARIKNQQDFLMAAAQQILAKRDSINVMDLANVFINNVKTNLPLNNLIWLGKEFLKMDSEDINFITAPGNYVDSVDGVSYVSLYVEQWLEIVNTMLNPFSYEITSKDVSILTRGPDRKLYITDGNWKGNSSWGSSSRGASESSASSSNNKIDTSTSKSPNNSSNKTPDKTPADPPSNPNDLIDTDSFDGPDDSPLSDPGASDPSSTEIPPLDYDSGQTQNPADTMPQPGEPSDSNVPKTDAPTDATVASTIEVGE